MSLEGTKVWFKSGGVLASIVVMLAGVAQFFGYAVSVEDQAALVDGVNQLVQLVSAIATIGGGLWALIGRVKATKKIVADPAKESSK